MDKKKTGGHSGVLYRVNEKPGNIFELLILAFQHPLTMFGGMLITPLLVANGLGMSGGQAALLISLVMVGAGICTFLQATFGIKLPIVQTCSVAFVAAYLAMGEMAGGDPIVAMQYITGAVILGGIFEAFIGFSNIVGYLKKVITPIVIGPILVLIALVVSDIAIEWSAENIPIAFLTAALIIFFSNILPRLSIGQRFRVTRTISVILSIVIMYLLSLVLSLIGVIDKGSPAHIDLSFVTEAPWFVLPVPFMNWGMPVFKIEFFLIVIAAYVVSIIESVGGYHAVSAASQEPMPTKKQIGKGIGTEGVGCILAGAVGGLASTSAAENIGLVETTGVASRFVVAVGGVFLIALGFIGKFGALFTTISHPILGGVFISILGSIVGVGIREFTSAPLSQRNLSIFGISIMLGLGLPGYIAQNPVVIPNVDWLASTINGILGSMMAVGGIAAIVLDQVIPATDEERGISVEEDLKIKDTA